jgi:hypothetical protein
MAPPSDASLIALQKHKLLWVYDGGGPQVEWPSESALDSEKIKSVLGAWLPTAKFEVKFLARGAWNQVFLVMDEQGRELIFRVALPVYPWYKTEAEVATIQFVRENTTIPVPNVYAFDSSADNELGYEWILMEKLPGVPYREVEDQLSIEAKLDIARTIAEWVDQLSQHRFDTIGSFYYNHKTGKPRIDDLVKQTADPHPGHPSTPTTEFHLPNLSIQPKDLRPGSPVAQTRELYLGRPVIQQFMCDWRHDYHHQRGPFRDLHSYIRSFVGMYCSSPFYLFRGAETAFGVLPAPSTGSPPNFLALSIDPWDTEKALLRFPKGSV